MRYSWFVGMLLAGPAVAQVAPPGIDFTKPINTLDGKPIMLPGPSKDDPDCSKCLPFTLGNAAANCLIQQKGNPAYYALAQKIVNAKNAELSIAEITAIRNCVDKESPLISGQIDPAIDPKFTFDPIK